MSDVPTMRRVPPGRAGRLWLQRRLHIARRGADILETKLRVLRDERVRLADLARRTGADWEDAFRTAQTWLVRGALVGGQAGVVLAEREVSAEVVVTSATTMGVRYPADATVELPVTRPGSAPPVGAALVQARSAYERATRAAAAHAAASAALRTVDAEVAATRRRLRAVTERWIPRVEAALADVELGLAESERGEGVRLRWAVGRVGVAAPRR